MERNFQMQCFEAEKILKNKLKIWFDKAKQFAPVYICEYLFHRTGLVTEMLQIDPNYGFVFDPKTLGNGIDNLFGVVEAAKKGNFQRAKNLYKRFETPEIRVTYLRQFVDQFDIYSAIGEEVIADLEEFAKTCTDPEFHEVLDARKRNIRGRAQNEKKPPFSGGYGMQ